MIKYIGQHIFDFVAKFRNDVHISGTARLDGDLRIDGATINAVQTSSESFADNNTSIMTSAAIDDRINAAAGGVTADPFSTTVTVSYTHLTLPTILACRSRWSPYH